MSPFRAEKLEYLTSGQVISVGDGIAKINGGKNFKSGEMVEFVNCNNLRGIVLNLEKNTVSIVILGIDSLVKEGSIVKGLKSTVEISVGFSSLGHILDPLGLPLDGYQIKTNKEFLTKNKILNNYNNYFNKQGQFEKRKVEVKAPGIIQRVSVNEPLQIGLKAIDSLLPIGKGQRELIIGDRQTGKTSIAIDAIINNKFTYSYYESFLFYFIKNLIKFNNEYYIKNNYISFVFNKIFSKIFEDIKKILYIPYMLLSVKNNLILFKLLIV